MHKMLKLRDFAQTLKKPWAIFFRYVTCCGISNMAAINLDGYPWVKNGNILQFLWLLCQIVCIVIGIPKIYSLTHLRCLGFELHKVIGQRSFQICTGGQNLKLLRFGWNIPQIVCANTKIQKKNSFVYSDALMLTYDLVNPFFHIVCV